jgi:hypothetical protein
MITENLGAKVYKMKGLNLNNLESQNYRNIKPIAKKHWK